MPFQYEGYRSPFANSIAELMLRRGDIAARQAEQSGNAWAGAAQTIGQAVAAIPQQIQQAKRADTADQFNTIRLNEEKAGLAERDIFKKTLRDTPMINENGMKVYDIPTLTQSLSAQGADPTTYIKPLQEINQTYRDFNASRLAVITQGAQKVKAAGDDPDLALHFLTGIEDNGVYSKEQIGQFRDLITSGGQPAVAKLTSYLIGPQKGEVVPAGATVADPITHQPLFTAPPKPGDGQHVINGQLVGAEGQPIGAPIPPQTPPKSLQSKSVLVDGKPVEAVFDPTSGKLSVNGVDVTAKAKPVPPASVQIYNQQAAEGKGEVSDTAKGIAEYRIPPPSPRSMASGAGKALMEQVMRANPGYDASQFPARSKMRIAYTSGSQAQQLTALNTAVEHLGKLDDMATALNNGSFKPGNQAYNWVRTTFGDSAVTNYRFATDIMSGELATAMKKSGATDVEISKVTKSLSDANSPKQLSDAIRKVAIPMIGGKASTLDQQWKQVMGDQDPFSVYTPGAKAVIQKFGDGNEGGGGAHTSTMPANVSAVLKGQKPGRYTLSDGSVWLVQADGSIQKGS